MGKHAYCIICHRNSFSLQQLIKQIDDERNDIYIIIDKKAKCVRDEAIKVNVKNSRIFFVPRIKIFWAHFSLVQAELALFASAHANNKYDYYHLMSGQDTCLKNQDEIHEFFDEKKGQLFIDLCDDETWLVKAEQRIKYYYFAYGRGYAVAIFNKLFDVVQCVLGINRLRHNEVKIAGGSQWCSLSNDFVEYILSKTDYINKTFRKSWCSDELFIQTLAVNSEFNALIYGAEDGISSNMRYIDWKRGNPYVFQEKDFSELINSGALFARKVSYEENDKLQERIFDYINNGSVM